MKSIAYIIAGPIRSGNRLMASILGRSGCLGEGSTRQPNARSILSTVRDGKTLTDVLRSRTNVIVHNILAAKEMEARVEVVTYEGLCEEALKVWLPTIGLPYKSGCLDLPGQRISNNIQQQNAKHYETSLV